MLPLIGWTRYVKTLIIYFLTYYFSSFKLRILLIEA